MRRANPYPKCAQAMRMLSGAGSSCRGAREPEFATHQRMVGPNAGVTGRTVETGVRVAVIVVFRVVDGLRQGDLRVESGLVDGAMRGYGPLGSVGWVGEESGLAEGLFDRNQVWAGDGRAGIIQVSGHGGRHADLVVSERRVPGCQRIEQERLRSWDNLTSSCSLPIASPDDQRECPRPAAIGMAMPDSLGISFFSAA